MLKQRGQRGDNLVAMVRVEWNDKNLGESTKVDYTAEAPTELNHSTSISINFEDYKDLDDVAHKPVLCKSAKIHYITYSHPETIFFIPKEHSNH